MSDAVPLAKASPVRIAIDGALVGAILIQVAAALYTFGGMRQQIDSLERRMTTVETMQVNRSAGLTAIAVRLGRIEQKLTDIGQKVGSP